MFASVRAVSKPPVAIRRLAGIAVVVAALAAAASIRPEDPSRLPPTVILVSLDGFRADYLERYQPPTLLQMAEEGVRAEYLQPVFPTKTFPNHYTLVTGRYVENHGIVANTMHDAELGRFSLGRRAAVTNGAWWDDAEPIWVTLHKAGVWSAMYFWPGSEAEISGVRPALFRPFSGSTPAETRIAWVMAALRMPPEDRPQLISLYFEDVDTAGHAHGPQSDEVHAAVHSVDRYLTHLDSLLHGADLYEDVNVIVTSDHGMAPTSSDSVVLLDNYVSLDSLSVVDWDPVVALNPKHGNADELLVALERMPHVSFFRKESVPARLHYSRHHRIPSIIGIADVGWRISSRAYFEANRQRFDGGTHGYDPASPSMHGIFLARGPAFEAGTLSAGIESIHIYELLCAIFGVDPAPNDGRLNAVRHLLR